MAESSAASQSAPGSIRLRERFDIFYDRPLPAIATPTVPAFAAFDRTGRAGDVIALIPHPHLTFRAACAAGIRRIKHPALMTPLEIGAIDWPPARRRTRAFVYERPQGGRVVEDLERETVPWDETAVRRFIIPIAEGLRRLAAEGLAHRAIRPSNLWFHDAERRQPMLGECLTGPAAAAQPACFEPIESAMAIPGGRGDGSPADDCYALGVTILFLALGRNPAAGISDQALLARRIEVGSIAALTRNARLPRPLTELIRGLLSDDPAERWTADHVALWAAGRSSAPRHRARPQASRPFSVAGVDYATARDVASALLRQGEAGAAQVRANAFGMWVNRALGDAGATASLAAALAESPRSATPLQANILLSRVAIALDPLAPIRLGAASVAFDGLAGAIATALQSRADTTPLSEIIKARLPQFWYARQRQPRPDRARLSATYDRLRAVVQEARGGNGIERALYALDPSMRCLSPLIEADHVERLDDLLPALERGIIEQRILDLPVDGHIAAFIAERRRSADEALLHAIDSDDEALRVSAMLRLLAAVQADVGPARLPGLTQIFGRHARALIATYRRRAYRQYLEKQLPDVLASGSLRALAKLLENPARRRDEDRQFNQARAAYDTMRRMREHFEGEWSTIPARSAETGAIVAATSSALLGIGVLAAALLAGGG